MGFSTGLSLTYHSHGNFCSESISTLPTLLLTHELSLYHCRRPRTRNSRMRVLLFERGDDFDDSLEKDNSSSLISTTFSPIYPVLILIGFGFLPFSTALLLAVFFATYAILARRLGLFEGDNDDYLDEEEELISPDFVAFGLACFCTFLLAPDANKSEMLGTSGSPILVGIGSILLLVFVVFNGESIILNNNIYEREGSESTPLSSEEKLMNLWDRELEEDSKETRRIDDITEK